MAQSSKGDRLAIGSWALYDFANSPFTTLVVTFIYATFFTKVIAPDEILGTTYWSRAVTVTALSVAFLSPIMGALADRGGHRKLFLFTTTAICVIATTVLYTIEPGQVLTALIVFVIANVAFEMGGVFYNAFLPDVAPPSKIGRVSGIGWGLGYAGGLLAMGLCLITLVQPEPWFGLSTEGGQNVRATNLVVAVWFSLFSIPLFLFVKEDRSRARRGRGAIREGFQQLAATFQELRHYRQIVRFLLARLVYNDGLVTIFAFGGIYAQTTFGFSMQEIMIFGIVLNVTAGAGAVALGFLDDKLGGKRTIQISLCGLCGATLLALMAPSKAAFWTAGIIVGIFAGPNQSASRSLMGRFVPDDKENEFFGFFAFSGKATAFMGPFLLGTLTDIFDSQRAGMSIVLVLLGVGLALIHFVDEAEGVAASGRATA